MVIQHTRRHCTHRIRTFATRTQLPVQYVRRRRTCDCDTACRAQPQAVSCAHPPSAACRKPRAWRGGYAAMWSGTNRPRVVRCGACRWVRLAAHPHSPAMIARAVTMLVSLAVLSEASSTLVLASAPGTVRRSAQTEGQPVAVAADARAQEVSHRGPAPSRQSESALCTRECLPHTTVYKHVRMIRAQMEHNEVQPPIIIQ